MGGQHPGLTAKRAEREEKSRNTAKPLVHNKRKKVVQKGRKSIKPKFDPGSKKL